MGEAYDPQAPDKHGFFRMYHKLTQHPTYMTHSIQAQQTHALRQHMQHLEEKMDMLQKTVEKMTRKQKTLEQANQHLMRKFYRH